jgi:hypothetical protein
MFKYVLRTFTGCKHASIYSGIPSRIKTFDKKCSSGTWFALIVGPGWASLPKSWTQKSLEGHVRCDNCSRMITYDIPHETMNKKQVWRLSSPPLDPLPTRIINSIPRLLFVCVLLLILLIIIKGIQGVIQSLIYYYKGTVN